MRSDPRIKNAETQTLRRNELELLKALAIIAMIFCHPVIRLGIHRVGYESDFAFFFGDVILGDYLGVAHAFMFAMGVGMVYSRKNAPADLMRRGVRLYLLGYALKLRKKHRTVGPVAGLCKQPFAQALYG